MFDRLSIDVRFIFDRCSIAFRFFHRTPKRPNNDKASQKLSKPSFDSKFNSNRFATPARPRVDFRWLLDCLLSILRTYLRYFKPEGGKSNAGYQNMRSTHVWCLLSILRAHLRHFKPEGGKSNAINQNMRSTRFWCLLGILRAHLRYFKPEGGKSNAGYQHMRSTHFWCLLDP